MRVGQSKRYRSVREASANRWHDKVLRPSMTSRLPSLRAVAIFVAAGRALTFTEAAKAVNLTPSAVSRRIRDLERELGTALFRRFNRRLELTPAGARYLAGVEPGDRPHRARERRHPAAPPRRHPAALGAAILCQPLAAAAAGRVQVGAARHRRPGRDLDRAGGPCRQALRRRHPLRQRTLARAFGRAAVRGAAVPARARPACCRPASAPRPPRSTRRPCSTSRRRPTCGRSTWRESGSPAIARAAPRRSTMPR